MNGSAFRRTVQTIAIRVRRHTATAMVLGCTLLQIPSICSGADGCTPSVTGPGWHTVTIQSGGRDRPLSLYVPTSRAGRAALPLVFDLHGSEGNGRQQALLSGLVAQSERHGFLLANPDGAIRAGTGDPDRFYWNVPGVPLYGGAPVPANAPSDLAFFRDALGQMERALCVNPRRIYATGFSGGARMASALACELSDRIAAFAPVAGLRAGRPMTVDIAVPDPGTCAPVRAVSILAFHGVRDPTNRYDGDVDPRWGYSVPVALDRWAHLDGCKAGPTERRLSVHVTRVTYRGCRDGSEVVLYRTDAPPEQGGGHIWPRPVSPEADPALAEQQVDDLDASALIWAFFDRHHL